MGLEFDHTIISIGASIGSGYIYHDEKCYRIPKYGQTLQDVIEWTQN